MFCITIALVDNQVVWTLLYNSEDSAMNSWKKITDLPGQTLSDDFGQTAMVERSRIAGAMLEDLDKSMLAHIERGIHNARTQAKAQQIALNDPILKTAAMARGQSPAIFSPQGNGHF